MGTLRKTARLSLAVAGIVLVVTVAFYFLVLPRLIDSQALKTRIQTLAKKELGAEVDFRKLELHLLPRPHVTLTDPVLFIPPGIRTTAASLRVYPHILPLFAGKVRIGFARLTSGRLNLTLADVPAGGKSRARDFSIVEIRKRLEAMIAAFPEMKVPRLKLEVVDSRVALRIGQRKTLEFTQINGNLHGEGEKREMTFRCASTLWREVYIRSSLDTRTFKSDTLVRLSRLRPKELVACLFSGTGFQVEGESANLEIHLQSDGPTGARAQLEGAFPSLKLRQSGKTIDVRCRQIRGSLEIKGEVLTLAVSRLSLDDPAMELSALLTVTPSDPGVALQVEGRDVDVNALRRVSLALLGGNETVQDIFDVVRGGKVPFITVSSEGKSAADLGDMDHLVIRGEMEAGEIYVSRGQMNLKQASGRAVISKGILAGDNLSARLGNSKGEGGTLRLGLVGDERPFHLAIGVQADLSDLPPVLGRLVDDREFNRQLALIDTFTGSARGRLVLGERTDDANVIVDVDTLHLEARYRPIPFPVRVTSGSCSYRDTGFKVGALTGSLGTSSFTGLDGVVDWQRAPYLQIDSGSFEVDLKNLLPWLSSFKQLAGLRQYYAGGKGAVALASIRLRGPLFSPRQWRFATAGRVTDLVLNVPSPSAPVTFVSMAFTADNRTLSYTDARVHWLDADLKMSGRQRDYLKSFNQNVGVTMSGRLGVQAIKWLSQHTLLPDQINLRPLTVSAAQLEWKKGGKTAFTASLATDAGGRVSLDLAYSPGELNMKKLLIDDRQSHATIGFTLREKAVDLSFEGNLTKASMDWILVRNDILDGSIKGRFKAHIDVDHPYGSTAQGQLGGTGLNFVWGVGIPVKIHRFSLRADGSRIDLASSQFSWRDSTMQLAGEVSFGTRRIAADLRLTADEIRGDVLFRALGQGRCKGPAQMPLPSTITGRLRVEAARFLYGGLTWKPLQAELSLGARGLDIDVTRADLCGIATPGTIHISPHNIIQLDFRPTAAGQQFEKTLPCLYGEKIGLVGRYDFNARVSGRAPADELVKSLGGNLEFEARNGRFFYDVLFFTVMDYLNAEKIITDQFRDVREKGRAFRLLSVRARLAGEEIIVEEMELDSEVIKLAGKGTVSLADHSLDLDLLVAVVKTVNRAVGRVPLLGGIFDDMFSVPVKVEGAWDDPQVRPLALSAVGAELTGIMEKIITLGRKRKRP